MKKCLLLAAFICMLAFSAVADEGMWLFNKPPVSRLKSKYGFEPTQAWLDHLRVGSVRFNNGGSGSFVSADGLTFTNHHVGRICLQQLSTKDKDYMRDGFYARTQAEEGKCPDLELNVLVGIEDVTEKVQAVAKPGMADAEVGKAQRETISGLETDCAKSSGFRCDVVTLYAGGMYHIYKYKKYTDVRVVFAPEESMAFFGGDPDNFEFPRYDLDIAFFRIYENGKPVQLGRNYLKWSSQGVKEGDLVFVSGHPGGTQRLLSMAEIKYLRDVVLPYNIENLTRTNNVLKKFASESEENARVAGDDIFGVENSLKVVKGRRDGLNNPQLVAKKQAEEDQLRKTVMGDPKLKAAYGDAWDQIAKAVEVQRSMFLANVMFNRNTAFAGELAALARTLVRVTVEKQKPSNQRLSEYSDARLPSLEQQLFSTAPIYKDLERTLLTNSLSVMQEKLGAGNPTVQKVLGGKTPAEVAQNLIQNTKLEDVEFRKKLYEGGPEAIAASTDPLIVMMRSIDSESRAIRKDVEDKVESVLRSNTTKIAKARFAATQGTETYPDATFTLRLSYGPVRGYQHNGKTIPWFTTMGGTYDHAAAHGNKEPYELPASWVAAKGKFEMKTPFNFVSTNDIIGGNSGSPTVNRAGEVVGIVFDMNMPSLVWNFAYDESQGGRCVHVDSRAIIESLRKIYNAGPLADELQGAKK
ncbi:MAG TPA: S46 family peptidase [Clostridia bacterium]|nr:S46 family peptidase [Clostridia bacterium]